MTIIKPFFQSPKLFAKKFFEVSQNSPFANMERPRARRLCKRLNNSCL
nr:MAG TPA: hypothetical protein [Bacteriophage sp.]